MRVVSDLGAASISMYAIVVAIVLGATSLYRELELKTIFPILARPIGRSEYLVGKYLGTLCTLMVFVMANTGVLLLALSAMSTEQPVPAAMVLIGSIGAALIVAWRLPRTRTYVPIPWAAVVTTLGWILATNAPDDRRVVAGAAALAMAEVGIVTAIATVFSSFSSPFLTATFTFGVFIVGRSADTLAHLPERLFGSFIHHSAVWLSKVVPNLMLYVPPRSLLTGEAVGISLPEYLLLASAQALGWSVALVAVASLVFRRRDFL
jgi:Cu-processing system permease protein